MSRRSQLESESFRKLPVKSESSPNLQQLEAESSRKLHQLELSPKKSILKAAPKTTSNARANLMAKDDKKIHFDLNENMQLCSEVTLITILGIK